MQAAAPNKSLLSNIYFNFGAELQSYESNMSIQFFYDSQKMENIRFNAEEFLNQEIPNNSFLIEVDAEDADGEELASMMNNVKQNSESMKSLKERGLDINIFSKGSKIFLKIEGDKIMQGMQKLNEELSTLNANMENSPSLLKINLHSANDFKRMNTLLQNKGEVIAFLDSLKIHFEFVKNDFAQKFLVKLGQNSPNPKLIEMVFQSFQNFNLSVKCESASMLEKYSHIMNLLKLQKFNVQFGKFTSLMGKRMKLYTFGKFSIMAEIQASGLGFVFDLLFV